jgi:hypothetical protein
MATQGKTKILSSPRISTLNNQKAIIKVGQDEYFITDISSNTIYLEPYFGCWDKTGYRTSILPTFNLYFGSTNLRGRSLSFLLSDLSIVMIYFLFGGTLGSHILSHDRVMNYVGFGTDYRHCAT